jgi:hypothetical protein
MKYAGVSEKAASSCFLPVPEPDHVYRRFCLDSLWENLIVCILSELVVLFLILAAGFANWRGIVKEGKVGF